MLKSQENAGRPVVHEIEQQEFLFRHAAASGDTFSVETLFEAFSLAEVGIIAVAGSGQVALSNIAADAILAAEDGLSIRNGKISASASSDTKALMSAILEVGTKNSGSGIAPCATIHLAIQRLDRLPLTVAVVPVSAFTARKPDDPNMVVLIVVDPAVSKAHSLLRVCQLYEFTPTETDLVMLLADGLSTGEIAERMGVKEATLRVYLKHIFVKTGVHRQTALITLLLNSRIPFNLQGPQIVQAGKKRI